MTQKDLEASQHQIDVSEIRRSTRIEGAPSDLFDPDAPRLGRRESEPHSSEITYLYDVLTTNFPESRTMWDLHHYFIGTKGALKQEKIDIQFDVSFFQDLRIPHSLSSYDAQKYEGRTPDLAINVLSKNTWRADLSEHADTCKSLGIPIYAVFSPYKVTSKIYDPPFLRVLILQDDGSYEQLELRDITLNEGDAIEEKHIIDVSARVPFRLGLMRLTQKHVGGLSIFRLIIINPSEPEVLLTRAEEEKQSRLKAEKRAEKAERALQQHKNGFGGLS